jgi:hypothetical protein
MTENELIEKRINELYETVAKTDYYDLGYLVSYGKSGKGRKIEIVPDATDKIHPNFYIIKQLDETLDYLTLRVVITHRSNNWCPYIELIIRVDGKDYHNYTDAGDLVVKELKRYMSIESDELFKHIKNLDTVSVARTKVALSHACATFNIYIC